MSVIRFTYSPISADFARPPLDFEIGAADGSGRAATSVVRHVIGRDATGRPSSGPPKRIKYPIAADGVAAINTAGGLNDLTDDKAVTICDYLTRGPGGAPTAQHERKVSLEHVVSVTIV